MTLNMEQSAGKKKQNKYPKWQKASVSGCIFNIYTLLTIYSETESHYKICIKSVKQIKQQV